MTLPRTCPCCRPSKPRRGGRFDVARLSLEVRRHRRLAIHRSLRTVAVDANVSAATLSRIERGHAPDIETYFRLCEWMGMSADYFRLHP